MSKKFNPFKYNKPHIIEPEAIDMVINEACEIPSIDDMLEINPTGTKGPQSQRVAIGEIRFDSIYEAAFYTYMKKQGYDIKRNTDIYLDYFDELGQPRKFYPDFLVSNYQLYEIKGYVRPKDECKRSQHPEVTWVYGKEMNEIIKVLDKEDPSWRLSYHKI